MSVSQTVDRADRDRAVSEFDLPVCVEAAAGTGKTQLMVERVVEIIRNGRAAIQEVVAITFTEAASAELRAKVRRALEDQAHDDALHDEERARFQEAVTNLDGAHIETIHAFAQSLLKERPIEAGITPRFDVLDELAMKLDVEEAWDEWFAVALEKDASAVERALLLDFDFPWIKKLGMVLNDNRDLLALNNPPAALPDVQSYITELVRAAGQLDALRDHCRNSADYGLRQIDQISRYSAQLAPVEGEEALGIIASGVKIDPSRGNQGNWAADKCREQKAICRQLAANQEVIRSQLRSYALGRLVASLEAFPGWYEERRRREGRLDFDDLLMLAQRLLREHLHVRRHFKQKFRFLLVDEFQDTDPLQVEIVFFLSEQLSDAAADWTSVRLQPGKLFVVGDPKQSIYRFRRADIAIYDEAKRIIEDTNKAIPVRQNFRCAPEIVDFVNKVFSQEMQPELGVQADYINLVGLESRATQLKGSRVAVMTPRDDYAPDTERGRYMEARQIASLVDEIVGNWEIEVDEEGQPAVRKASYSDIAILIPGRTGLDIYEEVFREAGLAYTHEGGWFFYQRQETRDLIAFLSALDNPGDTLALVATLRNVYGLADEELWRFKCAGQNFDYLTDVDGFAEIAHAFWTLRGLHQVRNDLSLSALVDRCISETRLVEASLIKSRGRQAIANLHKFARTAGQFQLQENATLHKFVGWLRQNRDLSAREGDSPFSETPGEELKLLTAHGAKGLEFHIVILANLGLALHRGNQEYIDRQNRTIHFKRTKLGNRRQLPIVFKTPGFDEAEATEARRQRAEWIRVLYVAATRARDHLVISSFPNARGESSWLDLFGDGLDSLPLIRGEDLAPPAESVPGQDLPGTAEAGELLARRDEWRAHRAKLLNSLPAARVISPSASETKTLGAQVAITSEAPVPIAPISDAARIGSALHRVLEVVGLGAAHDPAVVEATCRPIATEYGVSDRESELVEMTLRVLSSPLLARVRGAVRVEREVPFSLPLPGALLQGAIDLLFEEDGQLILADFKSDTVTAAEVGERAQHYRLQAALYTLACERLTGRAVHEFVVFFARPNEQVVIPGAGLAAEALSALQADALLENGHFSLLATAPPVDPYS